MTEPTPDQIQPTPDEGGLGPSVAGRLALYQRVGGVITPILTATLAFLIGGLVVLATSEKAGWDRVKAPFVTYWGIMKGTGLGWLIPGLGDRADAANDLQQTLILMTALMLTGLAVAFAFRCGMFNIGGQGQYLVGWYLAVWVGSSFAGMTGWVHVLLAIVIAAGAGALWAGIAGFLKATVGAHEVISTIMLNWIAVWVGDYLFGFGGPLQSSTQTFVPISNEVVDAAKLPVFWGDPLLQGLHVGLFISTGMLVVYWAILNRTTLGFEVRAVGFNPEAARYSGISVRRNYFLAMAISGFFAGLAGAIDVLGWQFHVATLDIHASFIGFIGIAVALLGRNTAVGVFFAALLFAALIVGTSTRQLEADVFDPKLATNLTLIIQGLIVLFVGADLLILYLWNARKKLKLPRRRPGVTT